MPIVIGTVFLFVSVPPLVLLLMESDQDFGGLDLPITTILTIGVILGLGFLVIGIQYCSEPGSLLYRISHGRILSR
jgi:hypothetical protein